MQPADPTSSDAVASNSVTSVEAPQSSRNQFGLTRRELEIVGAIGEAMSNKDIAQHFGISEYTVKHHLSRIFDKIGVFSRLELAMMARHHGLVDTQTEAVA
jgi:DNA-binding NarL/FixJ family response regulator